MVRAASYHISPVGARAWLPALLALFAASAALAGELREIVRPRGDRAPELILRFSARPEFVRVPLENSLVLVLDFTDTVFSPIRRNLGYEDGPIRSVSVIQFSRERVRMTLKLAARGKVEISRKPQDGAWALTLRVLPLGAEGEAGDALPPAPGAAIVVFDAGHGGRDEGARGRFLLEKDMALAVARAAKAHCDRDPRVRAYLSRTSDVYIPLENRSAFAARVKAAVFVSVHANSTREGNPAGVEIYFLSLKGATDAQSRLLAERENSAGLEPGAPDDSILSQIVVDMVQNNTINQSSKLANIVMRRMVRATRQKDRGIRQAGFKVLKAIDIPSILVECGFISNAREERLLANARYQDAAGQVLYQSVVEYLKSAGLI